MEMVVEELFGKIIFDFDLANKLGGDSHRLAGVSAFVFALERLEIIIRGNTEVRAVGKGILKQPFDNGVVFKSRNGAVLFEGDYFWDNLFSIGEWLYHSDAREVSLVFSERWNLLVVFDPVYFLLERS